MFSFRSDKNSGSVATYSSHRLIMGKEEIDIFFKILLLRNRNEDEAETWHT